LCLAGAPGAGRAAQPEFLDIVEEIEAESVHDAGEEEEIIEEEMVDDEELIINKIQQLKTEIPAQYLNPPSLDERAQLQSNPEKIYTLRIVYSASNLDYPMIIDPSIYYYSASYKQTVRENNMASRPKQTPNLKLVDNLGAIHSFMGLSSSYIGYLGSLYTYSRYQSGSTEEVNKEDKMDFLSPKITNILFNNQGTIEDDSDDYLVINFSESLTDAGNPNVPGSALDLNENSASNDFILSGVGSLAKATTTTNTIANDNSVLIQLGENHGLIPLASSITIKANALADQNGLTELNPSSIFVTLANEQINVFSGNNQRGTMTDRLLSADFVVQVIDTVSSNPVPGITVDFAIIQSPTAATIAPSLSVSQDITDAQGKATTRLTLGDQAGYYKVSATGLGLNTVSFTAYEEPEFQFTLESGCDAAQLFAFDDLIPGANHESKMNCVVKVISNGQNTELNGVLDQFPTHVIEETEIVENWQAGSELGFGYKISVSEPATADFLPFQILPEEIVTETVTIVGPTPLTGNNYTFWFETKIDSFHKLSGTYTNHINFVADVEY
jgi:hypothetical protein